MSKWLIEAKVLIPVLLLAALIMSLMSILVLENRKLKESNAALSKSYFEAKAAAKKTDNGCRRRVCEVDSKWAEAYKPLLRRRYGGYFAGQR